MSALWCQDLLSQTRRAQSHWIPPGRAGMEIEMCLRHISPVTLPLPMASHLHWAGCAALNNAPNMMGTEILPSFPCKTVADL